MRTVASIAALLLGLVVWATCGPASAQPVRVYRCIDAQGRVSLQDRPCPVQSEQERRDFRRPPEPDPVESLPVPAEPEPPPPPPTPAQPPAPMPPPPLWQCRNWKGETYESESGYTRPRCVPIGVIGPELPPGSPAAALCRWVEDDCRQLDDGSACRRWREKLPETERELRFAASDRTAQLRARIARIQAIVRQSCPR